MTSRSLSLTETPDSAATLMIPFPTSSLSTQLGISNFGGKTSIPRIVAHVRGTEVSSSSAGFVKRPEDKHLTLPTGSTSMVALQPNTSVILDQAGFCYAQYTNNTFAAIAVETNNSGLLTFAESIPADPIKGIAGSAISLFTTTEGQSGQLSISVFVQVNGSDVTQLLQTRSRGPWRQYALPVD